ncbi:hypothetical protein FOA43_003754 [Brettanomyces nanus]|uniref:VPS4-associated protein 1 n=1 Tax=Eeniella nana TaxID=13502 RepID=A0A875S4Z7_EENNA|nr:uncharacterized protein FOA43_003754 [Brettanomyces nanus]QPG76366.1 hypothetical protein FOA43_003754 [Brettanomyces nanus]
MADVPPFKNCYRLRHVAEADSKSCIICYKPSPTVLITLNGKDWFYVCSSHLTDKNFCLVIYQDDEGSVKDSELIDLKAEETILMRRLKHLESLQESKNSQFSKIKGYLWGKKKEKEEKDAENIDDDLKPSDVKAPEDAKNLTLDQIMKKIRSLRTGEIAEMKEKLESFDKAYKKFKLDTVFYRNRLLSDYRKQKQSKIQKSLQEGTLFPSVDNLPELSKKE